MLKHNQLFRRRYGAIAYCVAAIHRNSQKTCSTLSTVGRTCSGEYLLVDLLFGLCPSVLHIPYSECRGPWTHQGVGLSLKNKRSSHLCSQHTNVGIAVHAARNDNGHRRPGCRRMETLPKELTPDRARRLTNHSAGREEENLCIVNLSRISNPSPHMLCDTV
jgi:hypothetical protein